MSDTATTDAKPRMLQWWMTANFAVGAGFSAFMAVVTWFAAKEPERTLHEAMYASSADGDSDEIVEGPEVDAKAKVPLKAVLGSSFGLFLLVGTLSSMANNGINSQISNIMPNVYGMSEAETSSLIAVAGLLNIVLFLPAGKMMAERGGMAVYSVGIVMRLVGALGMAVVGMLAASAVLVAVAFMQILYQASPFARLAQPSVAVRFATFPRAWPTAGSSPRPPSAASAVAPWVVCWPTRTASTPSTGWVRRRPRCRSWCWCWRCSRPHAPIERSPQKRRRKSP